MRKGLTEVVFILDRSGSMRGLEADTIGGFNSMIEKQSKEEGEACISTVLFEHFSTPSAERFTILQRFTSMPEKRTDRKRLYLL